MGEKGVVLKRHTHLLVVGNAEMKLLNISVEGRITISEIVKGSFLAELNEALDTSAVTMHRRITFFDPHYGLLYILGPDNGKLLIYHNTLNKGHMLFYDMEESMASYSDSLELIHSSFIKVTGIPSAVFGLVEHTDRSSTTISITIVDPEGIKTGRIYVKKSLLEANQPPKPELIAWEGTMQRTVSAPATNTQVVKKVRDLFGLSIDEPGYFAN